MTWVQKLCEVILKVQFDDDDDDDDDELFLWYGDRRKVVSLISSQEHCQRSSPSRSATTREQDSNLRRT